MYKAKVLFRPVHIQCTQYAHFFSAACLLMGLSRPDVHHKDALDRGQACAYAVPFFLYFLEEIA
jgi:hypothetical protein